MLFAVPFRRHPLSPVLCTVQNADDLNDIFADAVDGQEGQVWKYQLSGVPLAAWAPAVGKLPEGIYALIDFESYPTSRCRGVLIRNVVANVREIVGGGPVHRMGISRDIGGR
jgi:hypothetical protein